MRIALGLAIAALVALVAALLTGNILAAVLVVMLALAGIVVLLREWRTDSTAAAEPLTPTDAPEHEPTPALRADEHSPDIAGPDQL